MRGIKFRAWDNKKKKWLMGYEYPNLGGFSLTGECLLFEEWSKEIDKFLFSRDGYKYDDLKIMQFIGLLDKNDKEIYEGDILKYHSRREPDVTHHLRVVEWEQKRGRWVNRKVPSGGISGFTCGVGRAHRKFEIIGNIYENKELLK